MAGERVAVLTGAGVSTGAGIPDFRGPAGVWTRHPERARLLEIDAFVSDAEVRRAGWADWRDLPAWDAVPASAHAALARLVHEGAATEILTQNFDGLHQAAGLDDARVVELHGTMRSSRCLTCGTPVSTRDVVARLAQQPDPRCACGGILKPDVVYFGEQLPGTALERAIEAAAGCEVFVAVGTTLSVYPVASLAGLAVSEGAELIIVNAEPTDYDAHASEVIREPIDVAVPALVDRLLRLP